MDIRDALKRFSKKNVFNSKQLFLPPVTSLVKKPLEFVDFTHIHEKNHFFNISDVNLKNINLFYLYQNYISIIYMLKTLSFLACSFILLLTAR